MPPSQRLGHDVEEEVRGGPSGPAGFLGGAAAGRDPPAEGVLVPRGFSGYFCRRTMSFRAHIEPFGAQLHQLYQPDSAVAEGRRLGPGRRAAGFTVWPKARYTALPVVAGAR